MIDLACKLPYTQAALIQNEPSKKSDEDIQKLDNAKEGF